MARLIPAAVAAVLIFGGCAREPDWRVGERSVTEQQVPDEASEHWVSPPTPYEEIRDQMDRMRGQGWDVGDVEPAGREFPGKYIVTYRR